MVHKEAICFLDSPCRIQIGIELEQVLLKIRYFIQQNFVGLTEICKMCTQETRGSGFSRYKYLKKYMCLHLNFKKQLLLKPFFKQIRRRNTIKEYFSYLCSQTQFIHPIILTKHMRKANKSTSATVFKCVGYYSHLSNTSFT